MLFKDEKGITGIDISVSIVIISIFIVIVAVLIGNIRQTQNQILRQSEAISYAIDGIEEIKRDGYITEYDQQGIGQETILIKDGQEQNIEIKDDGNKYSGFNQIVKIKDYSVEKPGKSPNLIKKLTVEISYKEKGSPQTISLSTYVSK